MKLVMGIIYKEKKQGKGGYYKRVTYKASKEDVCGSPLVYLS